MTALELTEGDVFERITPDGRHRYIRIGRRDSWDEGIYVQNCDGYGYLLGGTGRLLQPQTLASRRWHRVLRGTR